MVRIRGIPCAVADDNHKLREPSTYIKNPYLIEFVRKRRIDFRSEKPVCRKCAEELKRIFLIKQKRAAESKRSQEQQRSLEMSSSVTDQDETRTSRQLARESTATAASTSTTTTAGGTAPGNEASQLNTSESTLDEGPSTSAAAAAAAARKRKKHQEISQKKLHVVAEESAADADDDDDDYVPSPNVTNGARLPHIQPIPKRHTFVHANTDVLDIYMAGLTGG